MLIFKRANLIYFAIPKTGSTAIEMALHRHADIAIRQSTDKHMTPRRYARHLEPAINATFGIAPDRMAILRDPVARLESWYRFRARPQLDGRPNSTAGITFADFAEGLMQRDPPPHSAGIVPQLRFVFGDDGRPALTHLFAHERPEIWQAFLSDRLSRPVRIAQVNASPARPVDLPGPLRARLTDWLGEEIALHDRLCRTGSLSGDAIGG